MDEEHMGCFNLSHEPITFIDGAMLLGQPECAVATAEVGGTTVSTVFLVYPHGYRNEVPVLYETMVWNAKDEIVFIERYVTREAALAGHDRSVAWVQYPVAERPVTIPVAYSN